MKKAIGLTVAAIVAATVMVGCESPDPNAHARSLGFSSEQFRQELATAFNEIDEDYREGESPDKADEATISALEVRAMTDTEKKAVLLLKQVAGLDKPSKAEMDAYQAAIADGDVNALKGYIPLRETLAIGVLGINIPEFRYFND